MLELFAFLLVSEPTVLMRAEPTVNSYVVSELILGEAATSLEESGEWTLVESEDGYHGWIESSSLSFQEEPYSPVVVSGRLRALLYRGKCIKYGPVISVPFGARLKLVEEEDEWIKVQLPSGELFYMQRGDLQRNKRPLTKSEITSFAVRFLEIPYLWGGRSSFGYDCSGFVQMLYKEMGFHLKRDARDQVLDARFETVDLSESEPGDLIFFGDSKEKITHVGMVINREEIIHARSKGDQPWIQISEISKISHPFQLVRRLSKTALALAEEQKRQTSQVGVPK